VSSGTTIQRLRAIGQIEFALELQGLHAALLARVFLQRGLEHLPAWRAIGWRYPTAASHHHRTGALILC